MLASSSFAPFDVKFVPGTPVMVEKRGHPAQKFYLAAQTSKDRPSGHRRGSSSPEWLNSLTVCVTKEAAEAYAQIHPSQQNRSCTGASKRAQLIIIHQDGTQESVADVQVLVTAGIYAFGEKLLHQALELRVTASADAFDPRSDEPEDCARARAWRTMGGICETFLEHFPPRKPEGD